MRIQRHFSVACGARAPVAAKAAMGGLPTRIRVARCRSPGNRGTRQHEGDANTSQAWARIGRSKDVPARRVRVAEFGRRRSGSKKRQYGVNPRGREQGPSARGGVRDRKEADVLRERRSVEISGRGGEITRPMKGRVGTPSSETRLGTGIRLPAEGRHLGPRKPSLFTRRWGNRSWRPSNRALCVL